MRFRLDTQQRRLDELIELMDSLEDDMVKSHFSKYLCVRVSGYLENVIKTLIGSYIDKSCPAAVQTFVKNKIKNTTNLSVNKIVLFLENFDKEWASEFEAKLTDKMSETLNSVVSNRNQIAHGGHDNITPRIIKGYYEDVKEVVKILQEIIKK